MKLYVASSWRNSLQQSVVRDLRGAGHEVYDFRNPRPGDTGFHWSAIDPEWESWNAFDFQQALFHPVADDGFKSDAEAMEWADGCVLVLPCGRSAHLEAGWFAGNGKPLWIYVPEPTEPELMYKFGTVCVSMSEVLHRISGFTVTPTQ